MAYNRHTHNNPISNTKHINIYIYLQSKKKNEGGQLEEYLKTCAFENYELQRGHIAFNKFNRRRNTLRKSGSLKAVIRVTMKNPRYVNTYGVRVLFRVIAISLYYCCRIPYLVVGSLDC